MKRERFEQLGVNFQKRLSDGRMNHLAFIKDPDGYWFTIHSGTLGLFVNRAALRGKPVPASWAESVATAAASRVSRATSKAERPAERRPRDGQPP